jgi:hypothetical protein
MHSRLWMILILLFVFSIAEAKPRGAHQRRRIRQGVKSGQVNRMETKALVKEQNDIRRLRRESKLDDGKISKDEKMEIQLTRRNASQDIYRQKHDGDKRGN